MQKPCYSGMIDVSILYVMQSPHYHSRISQPIFKFPLVRLDLHLSHSRTSYTLLYFTHHSIIIHLPEMSQYAFQGPNKTYRSHPNGPSFKPRYGRWYVKAPGS